MLDIAILGGTVVTDHETFVLGESSLGNGNGVEKFSIRDRTSSRHFGRTVGTSSGSATPDPRMAVCRGRRCGFGVNRLAE